jgi:hypothetical protein
LEICVRRPVLLACLLPGLGIFICGCTSENYLVGKPTSLEQRIALHEEISEATASMLKNRWPQLPPYPEAREIPEDSAACKSLKAKTRPIVLSSLGVRLLQRTRQKPWAIFRMDVDAAGEPRNIRLVKSAGMRSFDIDFGDSIHEWRYEAPGLTVKDCIAKFKVT